MNVVYPIYYVRIIIELQCYMAARSAKTSRVLHDRPFPHQCWHFGPEGMYWHVTGVNCVTVGRCASGLSTQNIGIPACI